MSKHFLDLNGCLDGARSELFSLSVVYKCFFKWTGMQIEVKLMTLHSLTHTHINMQTLSPYRFLYLPSSCCQYSWQPCDCKGVVLPASCHYNRWFSVEPPQINWAHTHVSPDLNPNGLAAAPLISSAASGLDHAFNKSSPDSYFHTGLYACRITIHLGSVFSLLGGLDKRKYLTVR